MNEREKTQGTDSKSSKRKIEDSRKTKSISVRLPIKTIEKLDEITEETKKIAMFDVYRNNLIEAAIMLYIRAYEEKKGEQK